MGSRHSGAGEAPDEGDYLAAVEGRFVALRGQGFALSARDVGRVLAWQRDGVPLRVVLMVLEEAMRRWRHDGARRAPTLGLMERSVEAAMKRRAERMPATPAGASSDEDALWDRLLRTVVEAGQVADDAVRRALREVWRALGKARAARMDPWVIAAELDQALVERLSVLLDEVERATLEGASTEAAHRIGRRMSHEALAERVLLERARRVRERFGVPELIAVALNAEEAG